MHQLRVLGCPTVGVQFLHLPDTAIHRLEHVRDLLGDCFERGVFGDVLLVVLSRGLYLEPKWQAKQTLLLGLSSNSVQVTAEHSDHNIDLEEPEAAVAAIARVIGQLRLPGTF